MPAKTTAVGTEKGGEGKTLAIYHLATMLQVCLQCRTLVVGFDPQMHIELLMGWIKAILNRRPSVFDCVKSIPDDVEEEDKVKIKDIIVPTYLDSTTYTYINSSEIEAHRIPEDQLVRGPDLAFINAKAMATGEVINKPGWATFLREVLQSVKDIYDYILIDTNPTGGTYLAMALAAADFVVIPLKPEELDVEGFKGIRLMIKTAQKPNINPDLRIAGVFFNQVQPSWKLHKDYQKEVRAALLTESAQGDCPVFDTALKHLSAIADGVSAHSPISLRDPYCPASKSLWQLLQELAISIGGPAVPRLYKYIRALDAEGQRLFDEKNARSADQTEEGSEEIKQKKKPQYTPFMLPRFEAYYTQIRGVA